MSAVRYVDDNYVIIIMSHFPADNGTRERFQKSRNVLMTTDFGGALNIGL